MLVRESAWNKVRDYFTETEKAVLNGAYTGETICPRGIVIDLEKAGETGRKLEELLRGVKDDGPKR